MSELRQTGPGDTTARGRYAYDRFTTGLILDDLRFRRSDPGPGDPLPAFDLACVGATDEEPGRLRSDMLGPRPVLLVFGSRTCPVTVSARAPLARLHAEFGAKIRFVLVNTREAHPGEYIPQPKTQAQKHAHARQLGAFMGAHFEVVVDTIDGRLHRALGPKPNSAYLVSPDGVILYRAHWANDMDGLVPALAAAAAGRRPTQSKSRALIRPLLRAIGHLPSVIETGGPKVERDVWRAVAPFAVLGRLSQLFRFLAPDRRGPMALGLCGGVLCLALWYGLAG
ncbi:deiodinase-like protein [Tritonibacter horizontis]|uniref:Iodothyronine deiodinase n=1 Tax=Tritonibacter horizontis TaxID=1768241 RepID=A0A132BTU5_9RHOB|nr:deiodinase-like protein [Tritonibacter horizontis]KUP91237.1 iodothyronine deiodinase [Tritonibacter horizontis]